MIFNLKIITLLFLIIWGAYERISAIIAGKKNSASINRDKGSLVIFYSTIFLGYGVGIPVSFSDYGRIEIWFPYLPITGLIIIIFGLSIRLVAKKTLDKQFTYTVKIIDDHKLIISGIYKYIRHPSYTGQLLIFLGSGIAFANIYSIIFLFIPNLLASFYRISVEEKVLIDHFKDQYTDYMKKTKKLIPLIY